MLKHTATFIAILLILAPGGGCTSPGGNGSVAGTFTFPEDLTVSGGFSELYYRPVEYRADPSRESLSLPVDGADVINMDQVLLISGLETAPENLLENGFTVVSPNNATDDPVAAFRRLEDRDQPVYVSSGITLHLLHIFFDQILQDLEEEVLSDELTTVCSGLYRANLQRGCRMNAAFFAVPLSYLDPDFQPDNSIGEEVQAELDLIEEHAGYAESPVMGYEEDYSQYVPRGHYTASRELENYFKAMMWLGRLTFILNGGEPFGPAAEYLVSREDARTMTACALFTVSDLANL